jgi:hypothetical protein
MPGGGLALVISIVGDARKLQGALGDAGKDVETFGSKLDLGGIAKVAAFAGVAGVAASAIADMTTAAAEDQAEQDRLMQAIKGAGAATGDYNKVVDDAIAKGQDKAFTDTQTRDALVSLVTATHDVNSATQLLTASQDIARFANVDLATAADAVAKAHAGNAMQLTRLLPGLHKNKDATVVLAEATKLAAGQADIYANSAQGMQERGSDAFHELGETIGSAFLPMIQALLPALIPVIRSFGQLVTALLPVAIPLLTLVGRALGFVASMLAAAVNWLSRFVGWLEDAIGKLGRFLDNLNPLKNFHLPSLPFLSSAAATAAGPGVSGYAMGGSSAGWAAPTINIYGAIDPEGTARAVARVLGGHYIRTGRASPLAPGTGP